MTLKLLIIAHPLHGSITPRPRKRQLHLLAKQLKALHLIDGLLRAVYAVEDDECLSLRLEIRLGNDLDDGAIFAEELVEGLL